MSQVVAMVDVSVVRSGKTILKDISWTINDNERWVVIGPNGAGKTTLLQIFQTMIFPTEGLVEILGEFLGLVDVFEIRPRVGFASASMIDHFPEHETALDVVKTSAYSMTGTWRENYEKADIVRARNLMSDWSVDSLAEQPFKVLSEGEKKRVLIARALMANPEILLMDEPAAGLDIVGREEMVTQLEKFAKNQNSPVLVLITHHVEEIPDGFTHVLCLRDGEIVAKGKIQEILNDEIMSRTFGIDLHVEQISTARGLRWSISPK